MGKVITKIAMSKPAGRALDSKAGKAAINAGNAMIGGARKISKAYINGAKKIAKVATAPLKWAGGQIEKEMRMNEAKDMKYRREAPRGAYGALSDRERLLGSFKKGGKVKKTGQYKLHKGEMVIPAKKVKKMKKIMKSSKPGEIFNKFNKKK